MARIKIQDYIKDVELNRQRLVNATNSDNNSSLYSVVTSAIDKINENGSSSSNEDLCEIRWFERDGTLLKTEYVEEGGKVTPPEVNYDPEYLEHAGWFSWIGERFTNILEDVDYAPIYNLKDGYHIILFLDIPETIDLCIPLYANQARGATIDWGDGSIETIQIPKSTKTPFIHTYNKGSYIVKIKGTNITGTDYVAIDPRYADVTTLQKCLIKLYADTVLTTTIATFMRLKVCIANRRENNTGVMNQYADTNTYIHYYLFPKDAAYGIQGRSLTEYLDPYIIANRDTFYVLYAAEISVNKLLIPEKINFSVSNNDCIACNKMVISCNLDRNTSISNISTSDLTIIETRPDLPQYYLKLSSVPYCNLKKFKLKTQSPDFALNTETTLSNFIIKEFTMPTNVSVPTKFISGVYGTRILDIQSGWRTALDTHCMQLIPECILDILNKVMDINATLTFKMSATNLSFCNNTYVYLDHGFYKYCNADFINAVTVTEAFNLKNWTLSS